MIRGRYFSIIDDLSDIIRIRKEVFEKELFLYNMETDKNDELAINVLVYDNQIEVGTGRITLNTEGKFEIDMVCVLKEYRNQGFGEFIVRLLADRALLSGADFIYLSTPENTAVFFEKLYFKKDDSMKNEILIPMILNLSDFKSPCKNNCSK